MFSFANISFLFCVVHAANLAREGDKVEFEEDETTSLLVGFKGEEDIRGDDLEEVACKERKI